MLLTFLNLFETKYLIAALTGDHFDTNTKLQINKQNCRRNVYNTYAPQSIHGLILCVKLTHANGGNDGLIVLRHTLPDAILFMCVLCFDSCVECYFLSHY